MPFESANFLQPGGNIPASWLGDEAEDFIATWSEKAETLGITELGKTESYVYYRAYSFLYHTVVLGEPANQSTLAHSDSFTAEQLSNIKENYLLYQSLVAGFLPSAVPARGSGGAVLTAMEG